MPTTKCPAGGGIRTSALHDTSPSMLACIYRVHFAHSRDCHGRPNLGAGLARQECPAAKAGKDLIANMQSRIILVGSRISSHTAEARTHPAISASTCRRKDRSSSSSSLDLDSDSDSGSSGRIRKRTKWRQESAAMWLSRSQFPEDQTAFYNCFDKKKKKLPHSQYISLSPQVSYKNRYII